MRRPLHAIQKPVGKNQKSQVTRDPIHSLPTGQNMLLSEYHFNSTIPTYSTEHLSQN